MTTRTLYHFTFSPFARRVRLALAHKGLTATLVEGRTEPARLAEVRKLSPVQTVPILVEPDGRALGDSTAISHYLDATYPAAPRIWPTEPEALRTSLVAHALVDVALNSLVDAGTRYYAAHDSPAWGAVKAAVIDRAHVALRALAEHAKGRMGKTWTDSGWSAADMSVTTMVIWIEGWAARAPTNVLVTQLMTLGLELPPELVAWTSTHRTLPQLAALG